MDLLKAGKIIEQLDEVVSKIDYKANSPAEKQALSLIEELDEALQ